MPENNFSANGPDRDRKDRVRHNPSPHDRVNVPPGLSSPDLDVT